MSLKHNIPEVRRSLADMEEALTPVLHGIARFADTRISARAIGAYMRNAARTTEPSTGRRLRIQSGRLARAVGSKFGAGDAIGEREARVEVTVTGALLEYLKEITVPYAALHEHGGVVRVPVTARMRRFFWARFRATGDDKWKWMALTKKQAFQIVMPARPYAQPALEDELPAIQAEAEARLFDLMRAL